MIQLHFIYTHSTQTGDLEYKPRVIIGTAAVWIATPAPVQKVTSFLTGSKLFHDSFKK